MAKETGLGLFALCEALGVNDPHTVTRVVVDIRAGHHPMLYVERYGDAQKILAALKDPGIELRREAPEAPIDPEPHTHDPQCSCLTCAATRYRTARAGGPVVHGNVSGANIAWNNGNVTQNGR